MKKVKMIKDKTKEGSVFVNCPICSQKISGTSFNHLSSNFNAHLLFKHKGIEMEVIE